MLGKTLSKISNVTYSPKSFNNKFGVPLSLFNLRKKDEFGVFEIGMDKKVRLTIYQKLSNLMLVLLQIFPMHILRILKIFIK